MHFGDESGLVPAPATGNPFVTPLEAGLSAAAAYLLTRKRKSSRGLGFLAAAGAAVSIVMRKRGGAAPGANQDLVAVSGFTGRDIIKGPPMYSPMLFDPDFSGYGQQLVNTPLVPRVWDRPGRY